MTSYAFYPTSLGCLKVGCCQEAVTLLKLVEAPDAPHTPTPLSDKVFAQLREYLAGQRRQFDLPLDPQGTPFQQRVWQALQHIPYGETRSYGQVAAAVGNPKAARAVGMANHHNPLWIVIPCHRVVSSTGKLTGYAGGLSVKEALLTLEKDRQNEASGKN